MKTPKRKPACLLLHRLHRLDNLTFIIFTQRHHIRSNQTNRLLCSCNILLFLLLLRPRFLPLHRILPRLFNKILSTLHHLLTLTTTSLPSPVIAQKPFINRRRHDCPNPHKVRMLQHLTTTNPITRIQHQHLLNQIDKLRTTRLQQPPQP